MKSVAAFLWFAGAGPALAICPPPPAAGELLVSGPVQLAWRPEAGPVVAGQPFVLLLALCPAQARLTAVDATMPEHRHGMNYSVRLLPLADGRWRAEGLLWHMAGRWELRFDTDLAGVKHTLRHSIQLE